MNPCDAYRDLGFAGKGRIGVWSALITEVATEKSDVIAGSPRAQLHVVQDAGFGLRWIFRKFEIRQTTPER